MIRCLLALLLTQTFALAQLLSSPQSDLAPGSMSASLSSNKAVYYAGEEIDLRLTLSSLGSVLQFNNTNYQRPTGLETIVVEPASGATAWAGDHHGSAHYFPDFFLQSSLSPSQPAHLDFVLNQTWRLEPGHYSVHIVTRRIRAAGEITSTDIPLDIEPLPPEQEAALAAKLTAEIRAATCQKNADKPAKQLTYLIGEASVPYKLDLYLHPKSFYPFGVPMQDALAIASNRRLVVETLLKAFENPEQPINGGTVDLLARFQYSLQAPELPDSPGLMAKPVPPPPLFEQIKAQDLHLLAETLPQRTGESRMEAVEAVFTGDAHANGPVAVADYNVARENLITHFSEVNEYSVEYYLNNFTPELADPRILPALHALLSRNDDGIFSGNRLGALKLLKRIDPDALPAALALEACKIHPILVHQLSGIAEGVDTLPAADTCLADRLRAELSGHARRLDVTWTMEWIARFATAALVPEIRRDLGTHPDWQIDTSNPAHRYIERWEPARSQPNP